MLIQLSAGFLIPVEMKILELKIQKTLETDTSVIPQLIPEFK